MIVRFDEPADDTALKFAVIVARYGEKWVFCKHRQRDTFEIPGGHRETGESVDDAARRELYEETGATAFSLSPICVYSVETAGQGSQKTFGMLYYADVFSFGDLPESEMESVHLFDKLPSAWTYPNIQPKLIERAMTTV